MSCWFIGTHVAQEIKLSEHRAKQLSRQRAERHGKWAEIISVVWLLCTGHHILARRWRCKSGEIDIIARRNKQLIFVEVKFRRTASETAFPTIRQRQRICKAAAHYLQSERLPIETACRFDLILLQTRPQSKFNYIQHHKNAWPAGYF